MKWFGKLWFGPYCMSVMPGSIGGFRGPSLAPDGDGAGGGGVDNDTFTKDQVEQIVQGRIAKAQQELKEAQGKITALESSATKVDDLTRELADLKSKVDAPPSNPPPKLPDDVEGRIKLIEAQHKRETDTLRTSIEEEKKKREEEEVRRKNSERNSQIKDALGEAGCRPDALAMGANHFAAQISWDEDTLAHVFTLHDGGKVSISEGINEELPDFMKDPDMVAGGSGVTGAPKKAAVTKQLESEESVLEKAGDRARRSGRDDDIMAYNRQKAKVSKLQKDLASV